MISFLFNDGKLWSGTIYQWFWHLGFSHTSHLCLIPTTHSAIRLTSAPHISSTLIPPLAWIQQSVLFWPWLNRSFPPLSSQPRNTWMAILSGAHPVNLYCQSSESSAGSADFYKESITSERKSLQTKQKAIILFAPSVNALVLALLAGCHKSTSFKLAELCFRAE